MTSEPREIEPTTREALSAALFVLAEERGVTIHPDPNGGLVIAGRTEDVVIDETGKAERLFWDRQLDGQSKVEREPIEVEIPAWVDEGA